MPLSIYFLIFTTPFVLCMTDTSLIHNWTLPESNCDGNEKMLSLLDISKDCINRATFFYPNCVEDELSCRKKEKSLAYLDVAMNVISEVKKKLPYSISSRDPDFESYREIPILEQVERPMDCSDILRSGKNKSGVYTIWPRSRISANKALSVYCDMDTNGGGWTVIQRRGNFSTPKDFFYKNWKSYKYGFGNLTEEFWLGNDNIHAISTRAFVNRPYKVRFDMKDVSGKAGYAEYNSFWIEDEAANYRLHIEGYNGLVGDSMANHNKKKFSTSDRKDDESSSKCAVEYQGGWWYGSCGYANLNGPYQPGTELFKSSFWYTWNKKYVGLSAVEIKLRS